MAAFRATDSNAKLAANVVLRAQPQTVCPHFLVGRFLFQCTIISYVLSRSLVKGLASFVTSVKLGSAIGSSGSDNGSWACTGLVVAEAETEGEKSVGPRLTAGEL